MKDKFKGNKCFEIKEYSGRNYPGEGFINCRYPLTIEQLCELIKDHLLNEPEFGLLKAHKKILGDNGSKK